MDVTERFEMKQTPQDLRNKSLIYAGSIIDLVSNQPHESGLITAEKSFLQAKHTKSSWQFCHQVDLRKPEFAVYKMEFT
jgi:hypothetical protein